MQRCYLSCEEGDCVYVCVHLACPCSEGLFVLGGGYRVGVLRGVQGGVLEGPQGDLTLLLSLYTFLRELYSFYLRKRDQPMGKRGQMWENLTQLSECNEFQLNQIPQTQ